MSEDVDKEYAAERNKFVSIAEKHANETEGTKRAPPQTSEDYVEKWNLCFHTKMKELWAGRKGGPEELPALDITDRRISGERRTEANKPCGP